MPTWDELKAAKKQFLPLDRFYMMAMPPDKYYVNQHPFCLHVWEIKAPIEIDFIKSEGPE
jgi:hypothetical protein